jgi:hypothetical protein
MASRHDIITTLRVALEPLDYVHAMWEGGAAAFNRVDEWSDIDMQVDVDDNRIADTYAVIEEALRNITEIELVYETPPHVWQGMLQRFYRFRGVSPYLFLDIAVIEHSTPEKFLQPEIHGNAVIHFDKSGVLVVPPLDYDAHRAMLRNRLETLRTTFDMFQVLSTKEIHRGNSIEAIQFYYNYTLRPLVEVLRMIHAPERYNFHTRYVHYEFPADVVHQLEQLYYVSSLDDLRTKQKDASAMFWQQFDAIRAKLAP